MSDPEVTDAPQQSADELGGQVTELAEDALVEDVSIDGMCGVY